MEPHGALVIPSRRAAPGMFSPEIGIGILTTDFSELKSERHRRFGERETLFCIAFAAMAAGSSGMRRPAGRPRK
ncbi:hypothetical protein [Actinomadura sp. WMMA1423]|uniref:hypothetical protein n=1 Tax=Actinomadura sp. WMMA1423 TaxID=2591108 RepID=UPI0011469143|nr:hypothetical protein [Actinomadura sp. WMMA1423]